MTPSATLFEKNLAALRKRYPDYADVLSAVPETASFSFERREHIVLCRDRNGTWLHGPEDPRLDARTEAERAVHEHAELYILLRPGLGYLAFAFDEVIRQRCADSLLLVIEDRLDLVKSAFALIDWNRLLGSPRTVLLLGKPDVVMETFLERHPESWHLPQTIVAAPETTDPGECESFARALPILGEKSTRTTQIDPADMAQWLDDGRSGTSTRRVIIAVEDFGYLLPALTSGFRASGCDVELNATDKRVREQLRPRRRFGRMAEEVPDMILWANRPELDEPTSNAWRALGVANVLWSVDSPPRLNLGRRELESVDVHACFDATYLPGCAGLGARRAERLSLAAGIGALPGCGPDDAWPERRGPDVAFVGSLGEARVAELRAELWREQPECAKHLDALAKLPGDPARIYQDTTGRPYSGLPCFYVDEVRSAIRRIEVLSRIPRSSLRIFGASDWVGEGSPFAASYAGQVRYGADVARVYFHARVTINVFHAQCVDSTNSRVYDVLAAGGFLLSEDRPVLHREFEVGRHLVTFSTPDEAADKAAYYLAHPAERDEIAREGQRHVLEHHTFPKRCRRLLELAEPFVGRS